MGKQKRHVRRSKRGKVFYAGSGESKLLPDELKEWKSLKAKSKKYHIPIKRVGPANVTFGKDVYAQLGTGTATRVMDARIRIKKKYGR